MLQLTDANLARLTRAIRAVKPHKRRQFLQDFAEKIDPPTKHNTDAKAKNRIRVARSRARRKARKGAVITEWDSDVLDVLIAFGSLSDRGHYTEEKIGKAMFDFFKNKARRLLELYSSALL
jgi:hypothetical protein